MCTNFRNENLCEFVRSTFEYMNLCLGKLLILYMLDEICHSPALFLHQITLQFIVLDVLKYH